MGQVRGNVKAAASGIVSEGPTLEEGETGKVKWCPRVENGVEAEGRAYATKIHRTARLTASGLGQECRRCVT